MRERKEKEREREEKTSGRQRQSVKRRGAAREGEGEGRRRRRRRRLGTAKRRWQVVQPRSQPKTHARPKNCVPMLSHSQWIRGQQQQVRQTRLTAQGDPGSLVNGIPQRAKQVCEQLNTHDGFLVVGADGSAGSLVLDGGCWLALATAGARSVASRGFGRGSGEAVWSGNLEWQSVVERHDNGGE